MSPRVESGLREASLAEELAVIKRRRERLRAERERTEKSLRERDAVMRRWAVELEKWADEQRNLELEFTLWIKLQDLKCSSSMMWSPVQSLREKEQQRRSMEVHLQGPKSCVEEDSDDDNPSSSAQENETE
ncbi:high mobility group B protein 6 [Canna indica]|uniref:High mobility group B protein 6 n=1 Tax=Canna indica TaxID=4628 RepID=A0AAQ3QA17_9LILI|nr:high mobility group B protein 6 [Canna indica]